jgi:hypothetical protein
MHKIENVYNRIPLLFTCDQNTKKTNADIYKL